MFPTRNRLVTSTLALLVLAVAKSVAQAPRFEVVIPAATRQAPLTGRLVLVVAKRDSPEPRLTISPSGPAMFAVDLEQLAPDRPAVIDGTSLGFPRPLAELAPGDYFVQAVVNVYEEVRRVDGHRIWVHLNDGSQETFQIAAGNLKVQGAGRNGQVLWRWIGQSLFAPTRIAARAGGGS